MPRGAMPSATRSRVFLLFAGVAVMAALPICIGVPLVVGRTAWIVSEYAPTEDDQRMADELNAAAHDAGRELDVTAVEIAQARRLDQLDEVEAAADEILEGRYKPDDVGAWPADEEPRRDPNAFYRDEEPEPEAAPTWWAEIGLACAGLFLLLAAFGAAYVSLSSAFREAGDADG